MPSDTLYDLVELGRVEWSSSSHVTMARRKGTKEDEGTHNVYSIVC